MTTAWYGPFAVEQDPVCTVYVGTGDMLRFQVSPEDRIQLGGLFVGDANADGRVDTAGAEFPAPGYRKYSLVYRIGEGPWHQAGTNREPERMEESGRIQLRVNDDLTSDNSGRWNVLIERTAPDVAQPALRTSSGLIRT